jgi:glycerophosphoryl diester phosphodiesterase
MKHESSRITIVAHRGGAGRSPFAENSREAFIASSEKGFINECDVWASADGEPAVSHDQSLDRTTYAAGKVADFSASDLRQILLRTPTGITATLPLLADVAALVSLVEIKPANAPSLVARVMQIMAGRTWTLLSFDPANLSHARRLDPSAPVALIVDDRKRIDAAISNKWPVLVKHSLLKDRIIQRLRGSSLSVGTWTVNRQAQLRRILPLKPDMIITDVPDLLRAWLGPPEQGIA